MKIGSGLSGRAKDGRLAHSIPATDEAALAAEALAAEAIDAPNPGPRPRQRPKPRWKETMRKAPGVR